MTHPDHRLRILALQALVIVAFAAVALKLWDLQIVSADRYRASADKNQYRLIPIKAPRGVVYDRTGTMLVRNVPSFTVSIVPAGLPDDPDERERVLRRVAELLDMIALDGDAPAHDPDALAAAEQPGVQAPPGKSIETILRERTINPYTAVRIATKVNRESALIIEEEHLDLPGVVVDVEPLREYFFGPLLAHVLGFVGRIPAEVEEHYLSDPTFVYERDDLVGLAGIEASLEEVLRGHKGQKHIQVDAFEREIAVVAHDPPVQGNSVMLTIDVPLQQAVEDALRRGMETAGSEVGVAIVMDPRTGEILSMVSLPTYDNNLFSGGIPYEDYIALSSDPRRPLMNHAISGQYPPGSTFKIIPAAAALEEGVITANTRLNCSGVMYLPHKLAPDNRALAQPFYCWNLAGHGSLNVVQAIAQSCNLFFHQVAGGYQDFQGLGMERLAEAMRAFGFGQRLGIELPGEATGLVPDDKWKRQYYHESWTTGDTYNAGIGQGFVLVTPLQLLTATGAVANGGTLYRPQLIYQTLAPDGTVIDVLVPEPVHDIGISPENIEIVRRGMREAVSAGTAHRLRIPGLDAAAKTGTAEYTRLDEHGNLIRRSGGYLPTHAWSTAFAPYTDPEIAVVVFLDDGGEGSRYAIPVIADIMRFYFNLGGDASAPTG